MTTSEQFRRIALSFAGTEERKHMGHPDFRVGGKIFATLAYPDDNWGMVKLPLESQHDFLQSQPGSFTAASGAWGRQGSTMVNLAAASEEVVRRALEIAWRYRQAAKPGRRRNPLRDATLP